jgi:hypothetical protein
MIKKTDEFFYDLLLSPAGTKKYCYDQEALESRKKFKPENNVLDVAAAWEFP